MSIIKEIHAQPEWIRTLLFALSCVVVIALAGYVALISFERSIIVALDPVGGPESVAELDRERPNPVRAVSSKVGSAVAHIGGFIGFDSTAGFDTEPKKDDNQGRAYLLPLSE